MMLLLLLLLLPLLCPHKIESCDQDDAARSQTSMTVKM
jgi:hypothetical protein